MKKLLALLLIFSIAAIGCKKDEENTEYNTVRFTSGELEGVKVSYSPNQGFWSQVTPQERSYRIIFGDDKYPVSSDEYIDVFFYHQGSNIIQFPGIPGTYITIRIYIEEESDFCNLYHKNASLTITEISDSRLKGTIVGEFTEQCSGEVSNLEMVFDIVLIQE